MGSHWSSTGRWTFVVLLFENDEAPPAGADRAVIVVVVVAMKLEVAGT